MFGRKSATPDDAPNLLERAFAAGCTRLAVISLHPGAGARTVLECAAKEFHGRGIAVGVTRAPRLRLEALAPDEVAPIRLPAGTIVATTDVAVDRDALELLEPSICRTALGEVGLFRVRAEASLRLYGPDDAASMQEVLRRLDRQSGGLALVDGAWERRAFAAPGGAQAVVLVAGSGFSSRPESSAAALTHVVDLMGLERVDPSLARTWLEAASHASSVVLDSDGNAQAVLTAEGEALASRLQLPGRDLGAVLLPGGLYDELLGPLSRSKLRCPLVVRDPTCVRVAPIYYSAWTKSGGSIRVIEPMRVLAVATNPVNGRGPDADPERFRQLVADTLPDLPIHDVVLEARLPERGGLWRWLPRR